MSSNLVILLGNVGKDPVDIPTRTGTAMVTFSVATHKNEKGGDGKWRETTQWHDVVTLGKLAETCKSFLSKGRTVQVIGSLEYRKFTTKAGAEVTKAQIKASEVHFVGPSKAKTEHQSSRPDPNTFAEEANQEATDDLPSTEGLKLTSTAFGGMLSSSLESSIESDLQQD